MLASLAAAGLLNTAAVAQVPAQAATAQACAAIQTDAARLACYDQFFRTARPPAGTDVGSADAATPTPSGPPDPSEVEPSPAGEATLGLAASTSEASTQIVDDAPAAPREIRSSRRSGLPSLAATAAADAPTRPTSLLDSRWELFAESKLGTFGMRAYQPIYILPWVGTSSPNQQPTSPSPDHTVPRSEGLGRDEVKFQISWKTKAWQGVFGDVGDLWLAYTQSSRWQLYNAALSRPFRETNYEPEALLVFATNYRVLGWDARLLSLGLNHESNGRDLPRSRSWNRVTASIGIEREGWTFTVRPWWRIPEDAADDDNPDIEDYVGRADALLVRHWRNHELTVFVRHSLRDGDRSRGAVRLDWAFPIRGNLRAHVQVFRGYGESLIDYNHLSTQVGVGLSLVEWY